LISHILGIVADDLTGAIDTTGTFAAAGLNSFVSISAAHPSDRPPAAVLCINTETRNAGGPKAERTVRAATRRLLQRGYQPMYKKIDSTMRGRPGLEIAAMLDESNAECAFVVPAFPDAGRTQRHGVLYVDDVPLLQAPVGKDAIAGAPSSSVVEILEHQTRRQTGLVPLSAVEAGDTRIETAVRALLDDGCELVTLDAVTGENLQRIDAVLARRFPNALLAGSAGLASAIAERIGPHSPRPPHRREPAEDGPLLIVSGSFNRVTVEQIELLRPVPGIRAISMNTIEILESPSASQAERKRVRAQIRSALERGEDACITWNSGPPSRRETGAARFVQRSRRLNEFLDRLMPGLLEGAHVGGLVLVGGDTAGSVLSGLQADGISMETELLPGISMGTIVGGDAGSKPIVTKAGGFGANDALVRVVKYLRSGERGGRSQLTGPGP
jgi:uncharacterized protein YgbK (DUF1537 family)